MDDEEHVVLMEDPENLENEEIESETEDIVVRVETQDGMEEGECSDVEPEKSKDETSKNGKSRKRGELPDLVKGIGSDSEIIMDEETVKTLERRAKRFNSETISADKMTKMYQDLEISEEERSLGSKGNYKLEFIIVYAEFDLTEQDLFDYFEDFRPSDIINLNEETWAVKFSSAPGAGKAMVQLSKAIGEPKGPRRVIKHIIGLEDETESQVVTKEPEEEPDEMVNPSDLPIRLPQGKWRLGKEFKKWGIVLLRFGFRSDFTRSHYLDNDWASSKSGSRAVPAREEDGFDGRNPWGSVAAEWASSIRKPPAEYHLSIDDMERPSRRLRVGPKDWDSVQDPSDPIRLYPGEPAGGKDSVYSRLGKRARADSPDDVDPAETKTYLSGEESDELEWSQRLKKKPRMKMVADIEEEKKISSKLATMDMRNKINKKLKLSPSKRIKRRVPNDQFVVRTEILEEEYPDSDEERFDGGKVDLREALQMKFNVKNEKARPHSMESDRKLSDRFSSGRLAGRLGGLSSGRNVREVSEDGSDVDMNDDIDNMLIQVKRGSSEEASDYDGGDDSGAENEDVDMEQSPKRKQARSKLAGRLGREDDESPSSRPRKQARSKLAGRLGSQLGEGDARERIRGSASYSSGGGGGMRSDGDRELKRGSIAHVVKKERRTTEVSTKSRDRRTSEMEDEKERRRLEKAEDEVRRLEEEQALLLKKKELKMREMKAQQERDRQERKRREALEDEERQKVKKLLMEKAVRRRKKEEEEKRRLTSAGHSKRGNDRKAAAAAESRLKKKRRPPVSESESSSSESSSSESSSESEEEESSSESDSSRSRSEDEDSSSSDSSDESSDESVSEESSSEESSSSSEDEDEKQRRRRKEKKKEIASASKKRSEDTAPKRDRKEPSKRDKKEADHKSSKSSSSKAGGSSSKTDTPEDKQKADELRSKLKNYLKRAKEKKEQSKK